MYQSNQARIKKEIPSLLPPAVGKVPRPALLRPPSSRTITFGISFPGFDHVQPSTEFFPPAAAALRRPRRSLPGGADRSPPQSHHRGPGDPPLLGRPLRAAATAGPLLLPWQPPHLAVSAAVAATTPPWLPWPSQPLAGPIAAMAPLQQPAPLPLSPGPATTAPAGVPIQQVRFPPSPSPLPSWVATRQVSAAVRLQAAARGLLARRRVREMRSLQLPLLQVALRCAHDFAPVRCVGALGHAVSPTSGGHAVFPVCSDLIVCDIGGWGGAPLLDRSAPRNTTAFRRRPPRGRLRWSLLRPLPGGHTHALLLSS